MGWKGGKGPEGLVGLEGLVGQEGPEGQEGLERRARRRVRTWTRHRPGCSRYNSRVALLSADTVPESEARQIARWRVMSAEEKLAQVSAATQSALTLALTGLRRRHPDASERECFLRLAAIMIGVEETRRVYPDARALPDLVGR